MAWEGYRRDHNNDNDKEKEYVEVPPTAPLNTATPQKRKNTQGQKQQKEKVNKMLTTVKKTASIGASQAATEKTVETLVAIVRTALGDKYPPFLKDGAGQLLEPYATALLVHFVATNYAKNEKLASLAETAMTATAHTALREVAKLLDPALSQLLALAEKEVK